MGQTAFLAQGHLLPPNFINRLSLCLIFWEINSIK